MTNFRPLFVAITIVGVGLFASAGCTTEDTNTAEEPSVAQEAEATQNTAMSFFITSVGPGDGANLGGLDGADVHCQALAEAAGSTGLTWRAYLSQSASDDQPAPARQPRPLSR